MKDPAVTREVKEIVRDGYDAASYQYRRDEDACVEYEEWLGELMPLLTVGAPVLDLGCGNGVPVARRLGALFPVTGVDISPVQIARAQRNVPTATFYCADIGTIDFSSEFFGAIVSFYAIIHLPLDEQPALFHKCYQWLCHGGYMMATLGHTPWTGTEERWLGSDAAMYWSHADEATYARWLAEAGFAIEWRRFVPEGDGGHTLFLVKKP